MGWKTDPTFVIRRDPTEDPNPFLHSPPGSPQPEDEPMSSAEGQPPTTSGKSTRRGIDPTESPSAAGHTHIDTLTTPHGEPITMGHELPPTDAPPTSSVKFVAYIT